MVNDIRKILELAIHAPSGENCQPWRFEVKGNQVSIFNLPERDQSPYNFDQRGSLVAHGALIENVLIASSTLGYKTKLDIFPEASNRNFVARIGFEKSNSKEDPLYHHIKTRCTNRKPYKKYFILTPEQKSEILASADEVGEGVVKLTDDPREIGVLAKVGSMNERLVFENPHLHHFLFTHINWTEHEEMQKRLGFYIKTLELPPPAQLGFKLFRSWNVVNKLNRYIGLSKQIWKNNGKAYASSSAIGVVAMRGNELRDFVVAGRITERVWLKITKMGLSLQPLTGVLFFMQRIQAGETDVFLPGQVELIKESYDHVRKIFNISDGMIPMMFRIGYGGEPTARSARLEPHIKVL